MSRAAAWLPAVEGDHRDNEFPVFFQELGSEAPKEEDQRQLRREALDDVETRRRIA